MKKNLLNLFLLLLIMLSFSCKRDLSDEAIPSSKINAAEESMGLKRPGQFASIAGKTNIYGYADGIRARAQFNNPYGICVCPDGSLLIADYENGVIRKIKSDTLVSTIQFPKVKRGNTFVGALPFGVAQTKDGAIGIVGTTKVNFGGDFNFDYYGLWVFNPNGQSFGNIEYAHDGIEFGGIDNDYAGNFFWYTGSTGVGKVTSIGKKFTDTAANDEGDYQYGFGSISSSANGVKYFTDGIHLYRINKEGQQVQIHKSVSFAGISSVCSKQDGSKLYMVDGGDIKVMNLCTNCTINVTTLVSGEGVNCVALSRSEKYLYFTSGLHGTVNKLML